jgi:transposase
MTWGEGWKNEVLAYFDTGITNGRTEGFNLKATLVKRRAFGLSILQKLQTQAPKRVCSLNFRRAPTTN